MDRGAGTRMTPATELSGVSQSRQLIFRITSGATALLGLLAAGAGSAIIVSGVHALRTRELGLGAVGLQIALILVAAVLVVPGLFYLLLSLPLCRGRRWAATCVIGIASLHLLLLLLLASMAWAQPERHARALMSIGGIALLLCGYVCCLLRCLRLTQDAQRREFESVVT